VLVTGGSRGIGRAIAVAFAEQGDRVVVHYAAAREDAEQTLALLEGSGHTLVAGDLGDPAAAQRVADVAEAELGGVDVLVNNAGIVPTADSLQRLPEVTYLDWQRIWRQMVDVNLLGAAGSIVNVGSRGAFRGEPDFPAYGASKAALHAFGQSMAVALAPEGIAVTSVAPGFVATDRQETMLATPAGAAIRDQSPFGRVATPQEVAAAVIYLASPAAAWASGTIVDLNGASYLRG